jgi:DNA gyrase subunit A
MAVLSGKPDILTVSQNGYGKKTPVDDYRLQGRGGSGIINMRTSDRNGEVVASMEVEDDDSILVITEQGKIIRMDAGGVSRIGRATQGVRLIQIDEEDQVAAVMVTAENDETAETGE